MGGRWENRTEIFDGYGQVLVTQSKINPYRIEASDLKGMEQKDRDLLGISEKGGYEKIDPGTEIVIVETDLGRMAFPICLDFIDDKIVSILKETWANLIFVPAMSPTGLSRFKDTSKVLGQSHSAIVLVTNSCWCLQFSRKALEQRDLYVFYAPHREFENRINPKLNCGQCSEEHICLSLFEINKLTT